METATLPWATPTPDWWSLAEPPEWHDYAACRDVDTDLFFPDRGGSTKAALAICERCPVREPCLETALATREFGVWGGTTEDQRRSIRRERGLTAVCKRFANELAS